MFSQPAAIPTRRGKFCAPPLISTCLFVGSAYSQLPTANDPPFESSRSSLYENSSIRIDKLSFLALPFKNLFKGDFNEKNLLSERAFFCVSFWIRFYRFTPMRIWNLIRIWAFHDKIDHQIIYSSNSFFLRILPLQFYVVQFHRFMLDLQL